MMIHLQWEEIPTLKKIKCVHTNAKKYRVDRVLTAGKVYEVKSETPEYYFIIDDSGRIGGYGKEYFTEAEE